MISRLDIIKEKLDRLKSLDKDLSIFGSEKHKYISRKVSVKEIEKFESEFGISLPIEYMEFIIHVGVGAGPKYGILSLQEIDRYITLEAECYKEIINPAIEFEIGNEAVEAYFKSDGFTRQNYIFENFSIDNLSGIVPICHHGCTYYSCIVTAGAQKGVIWNMDEGKPAIIKPSGIISNIGFYDWYENWLDSSLKPGVVINDPYKPSYYLKNVTTLNYDTKKLSMIPEHVFTCENLIELNLNYNCLTNISPRILELQKLEKLNLNHNKLGDTLSIIGGLKNLKVLELRENEIANWHGNISFFSKLASVIKRQNTIFDLVELEILNISANKLQEIPDEIGKFKKLKKLWIFCNLIEKISELIGELKELEEISISQNKIKKLPCSIGKLESLKELDFYYNQLEELPESIGNLKNLKRLNLYYNKLEEIPSSIGNLENLEILNLSSNRIKKLPDEIGLLENLKILDLSGNYNILEIPKSMSNLKNLRKVYISKDIHVGIEVLNNLPKAMVIATR